jgi:cytochrome c
MVAVWWCQHSDRAVGRSCPRRSTARTRCKRRDARAAFRRLRVERQIAHGGSAINRLDPRQLAIAAALLSAALGSSASAESAAGAGDAERGRIVYQGCTGCHSIDDDDIGPRHRGVVGRRAGSVPGYAYSPALKASGLVWDAMTLDRRLSNPQALAPGTRMSYALSDIALRADVIAYLATQREYAADGQPTRLVSRYRACTEITECVDAARPRISLISSWVIFTITKARLPVLALASGRCTGVSERSARTSESAAVGSDSAGRSQKMAAINAPIREVGTPRRAMPNSTNWIEAHVTLAASRECARGGGCPAVIRTSLFGDFGGLSPGPMLARGRGNWAPQRRCARNAGASPARRRATLTWSPSSRRGSSPGGRKSSPHVESR